MKTVSELIERFGGAAKMAAAIEGLEANTVRQWSARDSVPARYWRQIVEAARGLDLQDVTYEALADIAASSAQSARVA